MRAARLEPHDPVGAPERAEPVVSASRIELHVEELALEGFPAASGEAIAGELHRELERALSDRPEGLAGLTPPVARSRQQVDAGTVHAPCALGGHGVARQVARAVAGALP